jgi:hypothetical protein
MGFQELRRNHWGLDNERTMRGPSRVAPQAWQMPAIEPTLSRLVRTEPAPLLFEQWGEILGDADGPRRTDRPARPPRHDGHPEGQSYWLR